MPLIAVVGVHTRNGGEKVRGKCRSVRSRALVILKPLRLMDHSELSREVLHYVQDDDI